MLELSEKKPVMKSQETFEAINQATEYLKECGISNPRRESEILLGHILGCESLDLYLDFKRKVSSKKLDKFQRLLEERRGNLPLQYLIGRAQFMGLDFVLSPWVFIPRPETEILVEAVLRMVGQGKIDDQRLVIHDLGCGCGNIACSLAKFLRSVRVIASDISHQALSVAILNIRRYGMEKKVSVLRGDLFEPLGYEKMDLIVSNPPYIRSVDLRDLAPEVKYEPRIALDGGRDGLEILRRVISEGPKYLRSGGHLVVEIGFNQADRVNEIFRQRKQFVEIEHIKDYNEIERVIIARKR